MTIAEAVGRTIVAIGCAYVVACVMFWAAHIYVTVNRIADAVCSKDTPKEPTHDE